MIVRLFFGFLMFLTLQKYLKYSSKVLGLAAVNVAGASLGKLMAIQPGNVTPLWPPSGIAFTALLLLGKRYWPGVLLGSFCFNSTFFYQQHHALSFQDFLCSIGIAIGSTLQALMGVWLVKRSTHEKPVNWSVEVFLRALLQAGPIACSLAASIGVGCLWLTGSVKASDTLNLWITWWFGDTTGVLLLGGLILATIQQQQQNTLRESTSKIRITRIFSILLLFLVTGGTLCFWQLLKTNRIEEQTLNYVLFFGLFSSLLLAFLLINLNSSREKALAMVRKATQELESKNLLLQKSYEDLAEEMEQRMERKRIIKEISRRNELILNTMTEGIFGYDKNGKIVFINNSAAQMLGSTPEQMREIENNHAVFHHTRADGSPYPADECKMLKSATDEEVVHVTDEIFWRLDGSFFPVEYSVTPVFQDGVFEGAVVVFRDMTEKSNQDQLLKEASVRFEAVFNQSFQFTALVSPEGHFLEANQSALAISGIKFEDVVNQPLWETPWWNHSPALQEKVKTAVQRACQKEFVRFEMFHYNADGETMSIDFSLKPLLNEADDVIMLIAEGRDITYIKKIEQEHRNMVVQLQETAAMRRTFVSTLTHDLKTPLIAQGRVLDSLQNEKVIIDDRHLTELMKGFIQNNTGVLQMINNLLETYELEDGRIRMIPESLSLYKLVHMCRQELQELLDIRKIVLDIKIPEVFPHIEADALLLKRVFQNLIGNAVSNIPNSSHIWIDVEDWDNYVDISVQDDGPGISEDLRPYLFSRYLSGASRQKKIGSGLGLYICKMISELHGGTIRVDSESGKGTKISFTILKETTSHDA
jgi:PAS domain S-box-containing protein